MAVYSMHLMGKPKVHLVPGWQADDSRMDAVALCGVRPSPWSGPYWVKVEADSTCRKCLNIQHNQD